MRQVEYGGDVTHSLHIWGLMRMGPQTVPRGLGEEWRRALSCRPYLRKVQRGRICEAQGPNKIPHARCLLEA